MPDAMTRALAAAEDQPQTAYRALEALVRDTIGVTLFTTMELDLARGVAWRGYSNRPEAYPVSGEKPLSRDRFYETVIERGEALVVDSVADHLDVFPDYELIRALGCESCLNLPVIVAGEVLGTLNCLAGPGHYTSARVAVAETLKLPAAAVFLMARTLRATGGQA